VTRAPRTAGAPSPSAPTDRSDRIVAAAVAALTFAVYLLTLYPSVGGGGDPFKFQYLGLVLGTAHPPGYPLYVLLSHLFSRLPIGTPAYRANVMSAAFGCITAGVVYLVCRRLGARRAPSAGAALALAFGRAFWARSVVAEVYTLNAALFAGVLFALLVWSSRRGAALYWAAALLALATGNHLTIVFTVPALAIYALLVDRRAALRPRTVAACAAIALAGLAQYLFILVRTKQGAPYLEARANTIAELVDVMRARRFAFEIAVFDLRAILSDRLPLLLRVVGHELTWLGSLAAAGGIATLAKPRPRVIVLLLGSAAGVFALTMNVDADVEGFLLLVFVALAPFVAAGADTAARALEAARVPRAAAPVAIVLAAWPLVANYSVNDHHAHTFERRYLDAVFERLPAKAAIASESYAADQLLTYKLAAEDGAAGRDIRIVPRNPTLLHELRAAGFTIFALPDARAALEAHGFEFAPVPLLGVPLWEYLQELRPGWTAIVAAPPGTLREWPAARLDVAPLSADPRAQQWRSAATVLVFVTGVRGGGMARTGDPVATIDIAEGGAIGGRAAPADIHAEASASGARIRVADRPPIETRGEIAVAIVTGDGRTAAAARVDATEHLRVPFDNPPFQLARVTSSTVCAAIGNRGWQDITPSFAEGRLRLRIDNYHPFESRFESYLGSDAPLSVAWLDAEGPAPPRVDVAEVGSAAAQQALAEAGAAGVPRANHVYRLSVDLNDMGQQAALVLETHGSVRQAIARASVDRSEPNRALVCGLPLGTPLETGSTIPAGDNRFFGTGWHDAEGEGADAFRWTGAIDAELLIPLAGARPSRIAIDAMPLPGPQTATIGAVVNGVAQTTVPMEPGWKVYEFAVTRGLWMPGLNQVLVRSARVVQPGPADRRRLGVAVRAVRLLP
jgi:transmembrane protein TMEM260 (protein O-mannosyltransferase)